MKHETLLMSGGLREQRYQLFSHSLILLHTHQLFILFYCMFLLESKLTPKRNNTTLLNNHFFKKCLSTLNNRCLKPLIINWWVFLGQGNITIGFSMTPNIKAVSFNTTRRLRNLPGCMRRLNNISTPFLLLFCCEKAVSVSPSCLSGRSLFQHTPRQQITLYAKWCLRIVLDLYLNI